jgi:phasin family protein
MSDTRASDTGAADTGAETVEQGTEAVAGKVAPTPAPNTKTDAPAAPRRAMRKARPVAMPDVVIASAPPVPEAAPDVVAVAIPAPAAKPVSTKSAKARPVKAKPVPKPVVAKPAKAKPAVAKTPAPKTRQPAKPAAAAPVVRPATAPRKELRIMTTPATEITEKFQTAIKDASEKAKAAFEKSQASFGEMGEFTKGNVEALVESTKILATGLQSLSKGYLTEGKTAFETLTAEMKELAAVKTPSELLEKQSSMLRKQFDAMVAANSKNSEAMLKLASEAFQPISTRVSLAVEKVKKAA